MKQAEKTVKVSLPVFIYSDSLEQIFLAAIFVLFIEYFGNNSRLSHKIE